MINVSTIIKPIAKVSTIIGNWVISLLYPGSTTFPSSITFPGWAGVFNVNSDTITKPASLSSTITKPDAKTNTITKPDPKTSTIIKPT